MRPCAKTTSHNLILSASCNCWFLSDLTMNVCAMQQNWSIKSCSLQTEGPRPSPWTPHNGLTVAPHLTSGLPGYRLQGSAHTKQKQAALCLQQVPSGTGYQTVESMQGWQRMMGYWELGGGGGWPAPLYNYRGHGNLLGQWVMCAWMYKVWQAETHSRTGSDRYACLHMQMGIHK